MNSDEQAAASQAAIRTEGLTKIYRSDKSTLLSRISDGVKVTLRML